MLRPGGRTCSANILRDFLAGHPEICRMKALMRSYVYWQGIDKDFEDMVRT